MGKIENFLKTHIRLFHRLAHTHTYCQYIIWSVRAWHTKTVERFARHRFGITLMMVEMRWICLCRVVSCACACVCVWVCIVDLWMNGKFNIIKLLSTCARDILLVECTILDMTLDSTLLFIIKYYYYRCSVVSLCNVCMCLTVDGTAQCALHEYLYIHPSINSISDIIRSLKCSSNAAEMKQMA